MIHFFAKSKAPNVELAGQQTNWRPTHRHKKGRLYRKVAVGVLETDRSAVVIYDDKDGTIWVRPENEFEDGRFSPL